MTVAAPHCGRFVLLAWGLATMAGAADTPNYDEARVPAYRLPDPLVRLDGSRVTAAADWPGRRAELLRLFAENVYGFTPAGRPPGMHWRTTATDPRALGGRATRSEIAVWFEPGESGRSLRLLVFRPNSVRGRCPVFLGLNRFGNHSVDPDPGITLPAGWIPNERPSVAPDHRATEALRGCEASEWQVGQVIGRGYALVTGYTGDLCADRPEGLAAGIAAQFSPQPGTEERAADAWGTIGVWAWGSSRALDVIAEQPDLDPTRVALVGHSRMGKTALWAGAQDERFAIVISNESGCGGAALSKRIFGETVATINRVFPHWFARNFRRYDNREADLPVDQHELLALIAPRPLYVASAADDQWADPRGEFLAAQAAGPVYALFGRAGVGTGPMPAVGTPVGDCVRYHLRPGPHDITAYDWAQYLDFADRWLKPR
ncbi:MAG TPA: acetylxylan esterase [Lacunisphaera sp.]|nr:acetylxylan esterase [Lacunisphaera sp.]